jgi:hypothetical protein
VDHPEGCQSQASCWCCCGSRAHVGRLLLRKHVVLHCVLLTALLLGTIPSLYCAVLCCAVLCCAVLCCAVLCCAVLCCAVLCCAVLLPARMCRGQRCSGHLHWEQGTLV